MSFNLQLFDVDFIDDKNNIVGVVGGERHFGGSLNT